MRAWVVGVGRAVSVTALVAGGAALTVPASSGCSSGACGCGDVHNPPGSAFGSAYQSLDCACGKADASCPRNATEYEAELCGGERTDGAVLADAAAAVPQKTVFRRTGCGLVALDTGPNLSGQIMTFDASSGALVGVYEFSDTLFGDCNVDSYSYGRTINDCDTGMVSCIVCGFVPDGFERCS